MHKYKYKEPCLITYTQPTGATEATLGQQGSQSYYWVILHRISSPLLFSMFCPSCAGKLHVSFACTSSVATAALGNVLVIFGIFTARK